ncbi:MAG TPA: ABC transporter ATP-binding protein [Symbiobacteriaceae bacterium]|jgi:ATP-binding cassette, subfamily B, multidrug efflux pump|nr:ABC transporter ATP-binding protein [Symbiobacteriaceae bacterium]
MSTPNQSLLGALSKYKKRYIAGVGALFVTALLQQVTPKLTGNFFDELEAKTLTTADIGRYVAILLGTVAVLSLFRYVWRIYVFGTARMVEQDFRDRLFSHLEKLPASFYHTHKTGDLMAMATNDLQAIRGIAGEGVLMSADALSSTLLTVTAMVLTIGWKLSLLALAPLPFLAMAASFFGRFIFVRSRAVQDQFGKLSDVVQENISGVRVVKAFGQEAEEMRKFDDANKTYVGRFMSMVRIGGAIEPTIHLLAGACFVLALIFPGRAVIDGTITFGNFVSLIQYINLMIWPMMAMGWVVGIVQRGFSSYDRIQSVLLTEPAVATTAHPVKLDQIQGSIEIKDLTFHYPDKKRPALKDLTVAIRPGQTLGIIGRTGSGKSTLVSLLARVFNPPRGTVFIDGVDVLDLPLDQVRRAIAFVPQESFLFSRTVGENIGFAPGEWTEEQVRGAAQTAQVEQDILEFLPEGYETMVGERGVTLSGGQRQRVGLSRAVLKNAPILVLDDCLSAVDTNTEQRILGGLRPVMKERTTVVISHRVAAVKAADLIIVLENGEIVESGTHDELLALEGRYFRTFQRQQLEEAIANAE